MLTCCILTSISKDNALLPSHLWQLSENGNNDDDDGVVAVVAVVGDDYDYDVGGSDIYGDTDKYVNDDSDDQDDGGVYNDDDDYDGDYNDDGGYNYNDTQTLCEDIFSFYNLLFFQSYIGSILCSLNPYFYIDGLYDTSVMEKYKEKHIGELEPHIYAIANETYYSMWKKVESQCILIRYVTAV